MAAVRSCTLMMVLILASALFAGPKIEFDTKVFKCGEVSEGKADKLNAVFNVKNIGDSDLKLTSVRPGCGCTVVKFDSLIKPGKSAKIEAAVNIANYRPGPITKSITVNSNAANEGTAHLTIEAKVIAEIEVVSGGSLTLGGDDTSTSKTIRLASKMKDLKASEVFFMAYENQNQAAPEWKKQLPLPFKYTWTPSDSTRPDGYYLFTLKISLPKFGGGENGNLIVKTNHPGKPEVSIGTVITQTVGKKK
jgi:hypothetical protein